MEVSIEICILPHSTKYTVKPRIFFKSLNQKIYEATSHLDWKSFSSRDTI